MTDSSVLNAPVDADAQRRTLVQELEAVLAHADGRSIKVAEVVEVLKHRGPALVMLLLSLPFLIPIPSFGLSTPLGAAIMLYGARVMLRMPAWVPGFIRNRTLSYAMLEKVIRVATNGGRKIEHLVKPRLKFMLWPAIDLPIGFSLMFCGFFLGLPLPIPFTNAIPAVALILLLLGVIEQDGVCVILGELLALVILCICGYVAYLCWVHGVEAGWEMIRGGGGGSPTTAPATMSTTVPA
ncbi:MAG TPA: exopolysaccharide biosynthesis protein [Tepidisphaeraceae bacterium]|jgi:hypothetical protein